ncbi:MAG: HRDC domain-containing protein [Pirellulaceae bacterium]|nr:HRDC domain-containing protein [Pirellulaceae bacterium]
MNDNHCQSITTDQELLDYCQQLASTEYLAFDTEFLSGNTYRSYLCLVQVATAEGIALIDPLDIVDMTPFWKILCEGDHQTIVHAGREELRFCLQATGQLPKNLFDIQLAAPFIGMEHPAAYQNLVNKVLGIEISKGETRTDWSRRPLSKGQLEYALQDVLYLKEITEHFEQRLEELDRTSWFQDEVEAWKEELCHTETEGRWRKVSGTASFNRRSLEVVRRLWLWREGLAERFDRPPKKILRDDLIAELARRRITSLKKIEEVRGVAHGLSRSQLAEIPAIIKKANDCPIDLCPHVLRKENSRHITLLAQLITTAIHTTCREQQITPSIVSSTQDVRDLISYHLAKGKPSKKPSMATGWRAKLVGNLVEEMLQGKIAIRIQNPHSESPLSFETVSQPPKNGKPS